MHDTTRPSTPTNPTTLPAPAGAPRPPETPRAAPTGGHAPPSCGPPLTLASAHPHHFNATITLTGGLDDLAGRTLAVDGGPAVGLSPAEFLVMLVLASHGLRLAGKEAPVPVELSPFLSAKMVLAAIKDYLAGAVPRPAAFGRETGDEQIPKVVKRLRDLLAEAGAPPLLIGNGPNGRSYRLDTPAVNIVIVFIDVARGRVTRFAAR
jgi:hypothetical protein